MAIEFHCNHCGKFIRTADEHGGKRGKCPACHNSVYIPTPSEAIEPLDLAPLDESSSEQAQQEARKAQELASRLRNDEPLPADEAQPRTAAAAESSTQPIDVDYLVTEYVSCMANGDLEDAEELKAQIQQNQQKANEVIDRILSDEMPPPALQDVPRPVLSGFLKQLRQG